MIYHLQTGSQTDMQSKIKTVAVILVITIVLPAMTALVNRIDPFMLPSVSTSDTSESSKDRKTKTTQGDSDTTRAQNTPTESAPPDQPTYAPPVTAGSSALPAIGRGSLSTSVPQTGGYGSGPVPAPTVPGVSPPAIPTPSPAPIVIPPPQECTCSTLDEATKPIQPLTDPVIDSVGDTVNDIL
jgi:hypothetical protein